MKKILLTLLVSCVPLYGTTKKITVVVPKKSTAVKTPIKSVAPAPRPATPAPTPAPKLAELTQIAQPIEQESVSMPQVSMPVTSSPALAAMDMPSTQPAEQTPLIAEVVTPIVKTTAPTVSTTSTMSSNTTETNNNSLVAMIQASLQPLFSTIQSTLTALQATVSEIFNRVTMIPTLPVAPSNTSSLPQPAPMMPQNTIVPMMAKEISAQSASTQSALLDKNPLSPMAQTEFDQYIKAITSINGAYPFELPSLTSYIRHIDQNGKTLLDYAEQAHNFRYEWINFLFQHGAINTLTNAQISTIKPPAPVSEIGIIQPTIQTNVIERPVVAPVDTSSTEMPTITTQPVEKTVMIPVETPVITPPVVVEQPMENTTNTNVITTPAETIPTDLVVNTQVDQVSQ